MTFGSHLGVVSALQNPHHCLTNPCACMLMHLRACTQAEELAQIEAMKMEELRKLQRDRRVLEKQSRALLKLPTKREKEEIQALEVGASVAGCCFVQAW